LNGTTDDGGGSLHNLIWEMFVWPCLVMNFFLRHLALVFIIINTYLIFFIPIQAIIHRCIWRREGYSCNLFSNKISNIILIADPQLEGDYNISKRGELFGNIDIWFNIFYFKYVYLMARIFFSPNVSFFLGDLLGNQFISDSEFNERVNRFYYAFPRVSNIKSFYIVGNHDVGYASDIDQHKMKRFKDAFGDSNFIYEYKNFHFMGINSMTLDANEKFYSFNETWDFIQNRVDADKPVILLTHFPLQYISN
jgi:hypothetical protein